MSYNRIEIFDTSCSFLQSITLRFQPYGLALSNGIIYVGGKSNNKINVIKNGTITKDINIVKCSQVITEITVDSFGYMAIICNDDNLITVYDLNGNYMNTKISTSPNPYITAIDSNGRYVIMTYKSLDIYY